MPRPGPEAKSVSDLRRFPQKLKRPSPWHAQSDISAKSISHARLTYEPDVRLPSQEIGLQFAFLNSDERQHRGLDPKDQEDLNVQYAFPLPLLNDIVNRSGVILEFIAHSHCRASFKPSLPHFDDIRKSAPFFDFRRNHFQSFS